MTAVCLALLYAPEFGGISSGEFKAAAGPYIWAGCIAFGLLTAARGSDQISSCVLEKRETERKVFLVAKDGEGWRGEPTRQRDGTYVTQIRAALAVTNLMSGSLVIVNTRLVRPKGSVFGVTTLLTSQQGISTTRIVIPG
jgi:hypothetical protein